MWEMDRYMDGHCIWKSETVPPLLSVPTALRVLFLSGTQVSLRALVTGNHSLGLDCVLVFLVTVLFLEVHAALVSFTKPCDIHIYQVLLPRVKKILKLVPWQG